MEAKTVTTEKKSEKGRSTSYAIKALNAHAMKIVEAKFLTEEEMDMLVKTCETITKAWLKHEYGIMV